MKVPMSCATQKNLYAQVKSGNMIIPSNGYILKLNSSKYNQFAKLFEPKKGRKTACLGAITIAYLFTNNALT